MPKTRAQKESIVASLNEALTQNKATVFASYVALTVKDIMQLRRSFRQNKGSIFVSKKTLLQKALEQSKFSIKPEFFEGSVATAFGSDEVTPAKILYTFWKEHKEQLTILGGIVDGVFVDKKQVEQFAQLPTKEQLYGMFVRTIQAPISGFVNVLQGNIRGLVTVLSALRDQKT